jgi:hypothetical protein
VISVSLMLLGLSELLELLGFGYTWVTRFVC